MVFDDHEIHAEWRISQGWLDEMNAEPWFDRHIRAGLAAYWVFQHIGNLSPAELAAGGLYDEVRAADDAAELLAAHMDTEGRQAGHSRWSYVRELGNALLVVIDSRAGRQVTPGRRELIQDEEWAWVREQARRPARHLLLASSVPFLLAPGLHHVEAFDEALTEGAWGRVGEVLGERLRRLAVVDHWASFQRSFRRFAELIDDVAHGRAGERAGLDRPAVRRRPSLLPRGGRVPPRQVDRTARCGRRCAPRCARSWRRTSARDRARAPPVAERLARRLARAAGVAPLPFGWRVVERPAYTNQIATLTLDGERPRVRVEASGRRELARPATAGGVRPRLV